MRIDITDENVVITGNRSELQPALEALFASPTPESSSGVDSLERYVIDFMRKNDRDQTISIIKYIRSETGMTLKDAKAMVDSLNHNWRSNVHRLGR